MLHDNNNVVNIKYHKMFQQLGSLNLSFIMY